MNAAENIGDITQRIEFTKNFNHVIDRIKTANNVDEIMLDVSGDVCVLFNADRLTIYVVDEDKISLVSKVKTGLDAFKDLKIPIAEQSIAGYSALNKKLLNIKDVYDEEELKQHGAHLSFLRGVDRRTGYHTKQMLVAPIINSTSGELLGVIQLINNKAGVPFFV
jgi:GAF domain